MNVTFGIPVTEKKMAGGKLEQTHIGNIEVDAIVIPHTKDDVDIDYKSISWGGVNILPLLDNMRECDEFLQMIHNATNEHAFDKLANNG